MASRKKSKPLVVIQCYEDRESFRLKRQQKEELHARRLVEQKAVEAAREREFRMDRVRQDTQEAENEMTRLLRRTADPPPPPPDSTNVQRSSIDNGTEKVLTPIKKMPPDDLSVPPLQPVPTVKIVAPPAKKTQAPPPPPPLLPSPDYDRSSTPSPKMNIIRKESPVSRVEMRSMDSVVISSPPTTKPQPPSNYFPNTKKTVSPSPHAPQRVVAKSPTGPKPGTVSLIISQYPSEQNRRPQPTRFEFLQSQHQNGIGSEENENVHETKNRLQSELAETLMRSNLKQKSVSSEENRSQESAKGKVTVSVNGIANQNGIVKQPPAPSLSAKYGSVYTKNSKQFVPSNRKMNSEPIDSSSAKTNDLIMQNAEKIMDALANKVTIRIPNQDSKSSHRSAVPNGILKNGSGATTTVTLTNGQL